MSDAPQTTTTEPQGDSTLGPRRLIAFIISFALGGGSTALFILTVLKTGLDATVPLSFVNVPLLPLAAIPFSFFFLIWVDYFMGTRIIPD